MENNILLESILSSGRRVHKTNLSNGGERGGWKFLWRNPFLIRLVLTVGMGALIIGYDFGAVLSDLPLFEGENEEFELQNVLALSALGAIAIVPLSIFSVDHCSPRSLILSADLFFIIGTTTSLLHHRLLNAGRFIMGFGVGIAYTTLPTYISECAPARIRGALVTTVYLQVAVGHLLSYPVYLLASKAAASGTWYWMMGLTGILSCSHFLLMHSIPESPRWLYRKDKIDEAKEIMAKIYPWNEFEEEVEALELSVEDEKAVIENNNNPFGHNLYQIKIHVTFGVISVGGLWAMCYCLSGYEVVIYYSHLICRLAGYTWKTTNFMVSFITSGLSVAGFLVTILFVDRIGRRRLLLISMFGIISCLGFLSFVFHGANIHSKTCSSSRSSLDIDNWNATSSSNLTTPQDAAPWNLGSCLEVNSSCLRYNYVFPFGICQPMNITMGSSDEYDTRNEATRLGWWAIIGLGLYIVMYFIGIGTIPFIVNSEIYPLRFRSSSGWLVQFAHVSFTFNMVVFHVWEVNNFGEETYTFLFFCLTSCAVTWFIYSYFPETKGVCIEEINYMFRQNEDPQLLHEEDGINNIQVSNKDYYYRIGVDGLKYRQYNKDIQTGSWIIN